MYSSNVIRGTESILITEGPSDNESNLAEHESSRVEPGVDHDLSKESIAAQDWQQSMRQNSNLLVMHVAVRRGKSEMRAWLLSFASADGEASLYLQLVTLLLAHL